MGDFKDNKDGSNGRFFEGADCFCKLGFFECILLHFLSQATIFLHLLKIMHKFVSSVVPM